MSQEDEKLVPDYHMPSKPRWEEDPRYILILAGGMFAFVVSLVAELMIDVLVDYHHGNVARWKIGVFATLSLAAIVVTALLGRRRHWLRSVAEGFFLCCALFAVFTWASLHYWAP